MGPARIYPWRKMRRSRAPSIAPGTFFVAQSWADCITNMAGFNLRQAQVPSDSRLEIEAMVSNSDIGFVHAGQEAEIKVDTFNFTRYGLLHGQVLSVSQDR